MKHIRRFLLAAMLLLASFGWAYDFQKDGVYYNILNNSTVEVTHNTQVFASYEQNIVIPSSVSYSGNNYSVIRVGNFAFVKCTSLGSVSLPSTITSIGKCAFYGCDNLKVIVMKAENPPILDGNNVFEEVPDDAKIYVPCGSIDRYKALLRTKTVQSGDCLAVTRLVGVGNGGNELELSDETIAEILSKPMADEFINRFGSPNYPIAYHPKYKQGNGPIKIIVIDPLNVVETDYELWLDTLYPVYSYNVTNNPEVRGDSALRMASHWFLKDLSSGEVFASDTTTVCDNEKLFMDRGISVSIDQTYEIGTIKIGEYPGSWSYEYDSLWNIIDSIIEWHSYKEVLAPNNGVITSSIEFEDMNNKWLDGIRDKDIIGSALNWIRSGQCYDPDVSSNSDYGDNIASYYYHHFWWDPNEDYEKIANETWSPFLFCSVDRHTSQTDPGPSNSRNSQSMDYFKKTSSVDIVLTSDKSKWTRSPVIEMSMDKNVSEGNASRFCLRKHASVDKNGHFLDGDYSQMEASSNPDDPNYIAAQGMGWFPGYAIDVETGMRLNIAFGEDSYLEDYNGNDMLFNPPALKVNTINEIYGDSTQYYDPVLYKDGIPLFGGRHYVYVWRADSIPVVASAPYKNIKNYGYDGGQLLFNTMNFIQNLSNQNYVKVFNNYLYRMVMWVGMPMGIEGKEWLQEGNDARIRIRIAKPYETGYGMALQVDNPNLEINNMFPKYQFSTRGYQVPQNEETAWKYFNEENFYGSEYYVLASSSSPSCGSVEYLKQPSCDDNSVILKAVPANNHSQFINWTENGVEVSHNLDYSFATQSDRILLANFGFAFEISAHSVDEVLGSVHITQQPDCGNSKATVLAIPRNGNSFSNWTINGEVVSTANPYTFMVDNDIELVGNFKGTGVDEEIDQNVTISPNPAMERVRITCKDMKSITLCTFEGRFVKVCDNLDTDETEIDLTGLPNGLYLLRIELQNGLIINKKMIKE